MNTGWVLLPLDPEPLNSSDRVTHGGILLGSLNDQHTWEFSLILLVHGPGHSDNGADRLRCLIEVQEGTEFLSPRKRRERVLIDFELRKDTHGGPPN